KTLLIHLRFDFPDLRFPEQEFTLASRFMIVVRSLRIGCYVDPLDKQFAPVQVAVSILEVDLAFFYRLDLRTFQNHTRDILVQQFVVEGRLTISDVYVIRKALLAHDNLYNINKSNRHPGHGRYREVTEFLVQKLIVRG